MLLAGTTGKIAGRVTDKLTGEPLPLVNVIIVNEAVGAATDLDGNFVILNVNPGSYDLKVKSIDRV